MRDESDRNKLSRRRFNLMAAAALAAAPAAYLTAHAQRRRGKSQGPQQINKGAEVQVQTKNLPKGALSFHGEISPQNEREIRTHEVPPIIVDSGSFEIGLPSDLSRASNNPGTHTRRVKMQTLTGSGFDNRILGVRVLVYNEVGGFTRNDLWTDPSGIQVSIWLQAWRDNIWVQGDLAGEAHVLLRGGPPFTVEIDRELTDRSKSVHGMGTKRAVKYRHDANQDTIFRFGKVEITFSNSGWVRYLTGENEEYRICLWNELD